MADRFIIRPSVPEDAELAGMLTVNECMALYAGGPFGGIAEVSITPDNR